MAERLFRITQSVRDVAEVLLGRKAKDDDARRPFRLSDRLSRFRARDSRRSTHRLPGLEEGGLGIIFPLPGEFLRQVGEGSSTGRRVDGVHHAPPVATMFVAKLAPFFLNAHLLSPFLIRGSLALCFGIIPTRTQFLSNSILYSFLPYLSTRKRPFQAPTSLFPYARMISPIFARKALIASELSGRCG